MSGLNFRGHSALLCYTEAISFGNRQARPVTAEPLHICHVIHRLEFGGLQNGVVNIINGLDRRRFRHTVLCLTDATAFKARITNPDTRIVEIHKAAGKDAGAYWRVFRALRALRPDIVHTRNLPAVDMIYIARLAGVARVVHSEHGLDVFELDGRNAKYNRLRRWTRPLVEHYVTMSADLARWMREDVGVAADKVSDFYNGVDTEHFRPREKPMDLPPDGFADEDSIILGTVGRLQAVKDQVTLARAFTRALELRPGLARRLRLVIVGDGELRNRIEDVLRGARTSHLAWMAGFQADATPFYNLFDIFILSSIREGISNTLLEAQASGLPVIATAVGGNPEIVAASRAGTLVPPQDPQAIAQAIVRYVEEPELMARHGAFARARMEADFSLNRMLKDYERLYEGGLS
jgi:sugar transferase (PEP-CTERM/EpsH1 system associated)